MAGARRGSDGAALARVGARPYHETFSLRATSGGHREGDEDEQRYEVELKKDGRHISTDVTADVGVVEIDEELRQYQLPEKVMKSFRRAFPKGEIKRSEKSADIRVTYPIEVTTDGRKREVTLSPRGKILEIEKRD